MIVEIHCTRLVLGLTPLNHAWLKKQCFSTLFCTSNMQRATLYITLFFLNKSKWN